MGVGLGRGLGGWVRVGPRGLGSGVGIGVGFWGRVWALGWTMVVGFGVGGKVMRRAKWVGLGVGVGRRHRVGRKGSLSAGVGCWGKGCA